MSASNGTLQVRSSWQFTGGIIYQSQPTTFTVAQLLAIGPTPGALLASIHGTQVSLAQLTTPGLCLFANVDQTNYYQWGVYLPLYAIFVPIGAVYPGQIWGFYLDQYFGRGEGSDTGTTPEESGIQLWIKGIGGPTQAVVSAFNQ
jgi:hypothetical protein